MWTEKTLIRLGGYLGWSESLLGAKVILLVLSCGGSNYELNNEITDSLSYYIRPLPWAASSDFVSSSIPSWQILTAHAQPFRGARDLVFCLKVPLDSQLVWASSGGSGETARMRRLAWTFAARIGDKYQIRLTRSTLIVSLLLMLTYTTIWATSRENVSSGIFDQVRFKPACSATETS